MEKPPRYRSGRSALILFVLILFQGLGWLLTWQAIQWQAKLAAQSALFQEDTPVREDILQQDFFQQSKVGKREIRLEGNLYDIRSSELLGDSIKLVLYHDWHEQMLYSVLGIHFSRLDRSTGSEPQPLSVWVAQWLGSAFILPTEFTITLAERSRGKSCFSLAFLLCLRIPGCTLHSPRVVFVVA